MEQCWPAQRSPAKHVHQSPHTPHHTFTQRGTPFTHGKAKSAWQVRYHCVALSNAQRTCAASKTVGSSGALRIRLSSAVSQSAFTWYSALLDRSDSAGAAESHSCSGRACTGLNSFFWQPVTEPGTKVRGAPLGSLIVMGSGCALFALTSGLLSSCCASSSADASAARRCL